jgi:putative ABC transport system permease protein
VTTLPMSAIGIDHDIPIRVEHREPAVGEELLADFRIATPGYFDAMSIPLIMGREFADRDHDQAPRVVVVNRLFVDRFLGGEAPLGKRVRFLRSTEWMEIVGVVGQVRHRALDAEPKPELFMPHSQLQYGGMTVVVRTKGDPLALAEPFKRTLASLDPNLPITQMRTVTDLLNGTLAQRRFNTALFLAFAGVALALAAIGIYGVMSYTVSGRTRELGIRMALGAGRRQVIQTVVGAGVRLAALGTAVGLVGALIVTRALRGMLYGISSTDPLTFGAVAATLILVAVVACLVPARRATRVDPMVALRTE